MIISAIQKPLELQVFGTCTHTLWARKPEFAMAPFYLTECQVTGDLGRYRDGRCDGTVLPVTRGPATLVVRAGDKRVELKAQLRTAALGYLRKHPILFVHEQEDEPVRDALKAGERLLASYPELGTFVVDAVFGGKTYPNVSLASGDGDDWGFVVSHEAPTPTGC